jgi:hypothetical protein
LPVGRFATLFDDLSGIVRNTCRTQDTAEDEPKFEVVTIANAQWRRALVLIAQIRL